MPITHSDSRQTSPVTSAVSSHQEGYVAHVAKQLAKSGKLADMLNGRDEFLRHVAPEARDDLIKIARAVRYALAMRGAPALA